MSPRPREFPGSSEVIVVGAGGCGLVAALAAARRGARVLVLEKTGDVGGTTALSHGSILAAGSRYQRQAGVEDDPADLVDEILRRNAYQGDVELTSCLARSSTALVDWLVETTGV